MKFEEFQQEMDWWGIEADGFAARVENEQAWKVSIDEVIARNFNLDIKNPHVGETASHDPNELLASYQQQQQELEGLLVRPGYAGRCTYPRQVNNNHV